MKMIPFCEPWFRPSYADDVRDQVASGWVGPGPKCEEFALAVAEFVNSPSCVLTTSGTIALSVAAKALGLEAGDEILIPAYGVISTVQAFASIGLRPRFVDIEKHSGCIGVDQVANRLTPKTRAVCFVNFSGYTGPNVAELAEFCEAKGIPMIEDAACAFGHRHDSRAAGTFGAIGTYSFSVPKIVTSGQGGALVTASDAYRKRAIEYIDQGDTEWRKTNINRHVGTNLRFNDISASFAFAQLKDISARLERKRAVYKILQERLRDFLFQVPGDEASLHHIVFAENREQLIEHLHAQKIKAALQYRVLTDHPPFAHLHDESFPNAEFWSKHAVYLPFGLALDPSDAERIANAVSSVSKNLLPIAKGTRFDNGRSLSA